MNNSFNRKYGAALSMINMAVSLIIGFIYTPLVLRFLGKSEYGIYTLANSLISYLAILDLGFGNTLVRYTARARAEGKEEKNIYGLFLIFYTLISAVALIIGSVIYFKLGAFFKTSFSGEEITILRSVFVVLLINTIIAFPTSVFSAIIRSYEKFVFINTLNLLQNVFRHVVTLIVLFFGCKSLSIAVIALLSTIIMAVINIYFCFKKLKIKIGFKRFEKEFYTEVFMFSFFILINIIVDQLYANTDNIILGKVCGSAAVAIYGIGVTFQTYFVQFSTAISGVFLPHITKLSVLKSGKAQMSDLFIRVGRIQFQVLSFILTGFLVFGRQFIRLWAGQGFHDAYYIALFVMVPALIPLSQNIGISVLQALNKHSVRSIMYFVIAILNVLISIPLAMKYGGVGAAMGTAVGNVLGQILFMNWFYFKKIGLDIPKYWRQIIMISIKTIPIALIFMIVNFVVPLQGWNGLLLKGILGVAISTPYYYFVVFNEYEKSLVGNTIGKVVRR